MINVTINATRFSSKVVSVGSLYDGLVSLDYYRVHQSGLYDMK
jgi:hypothetical protein